MMRAGGIGWERTKRALTNRFDPGDVERSVDAHGSRELEPDRHRINYLLDLKWVKKPRSQLLGLSS